MDHVVARDQFLEMIQEGQRRGYAVNVSDIILSSDKIFGLSVVETFEGPAFFANDLALVSDNYYAYQLALAILGPEYNVYNRIAADEAGVPPSFDLSWLATLQDFHRPINNNILHLFKPKSIVRANVRDSAVQTLFYGGSPMPEKIPLHGTLRDSGLRSRVPDNYLIPDLNIDKQREEELSYVRTAFMVALRKRITHLIIIKHPTILGNILSDPLFFGVAMDVQPPILNNGFLATIAPLNLTTQYDFDTLKTYFDIVFDSYEIVRLDTETVQTGEDLIDALSKGLISVDQWQNDHTELLLRYRNSRLSNMTVFSL
jgi:hypothetical protein